MRYRRMLIRPKKHRRLRLETLEQRALLAAVPFGATRADTAEYMLGDVHVNVVFIESSESSPNTETWTPAVIASTKNKIEVGLEWWVDTLHNYFPSAYLNFDIDFTQADAPFVVDMEPVLGTSFQTLDFVGEYLVSQGYSTGSVDDRILTLNHDRRVANQTNWAFTIFVVNAENDTNGFEPGGFQGAFAFPGGRYIVSLSDRPAETITHETGHIFWALDEYTGGDSYTLRRGYYNVQNTNAMTGAPGGFVQQPSIMATGTSLTQSFLNHVLPEATRAHIGWRDLDGDKIIDVLDVSHTLTGSGRVEPSTGEYVFVGKSSVRTLPNQNSVGTQNDITINRIRVAEYSVDGGATWQSAATYDADSVDLNLRIPLSGQPTIAIRTRDTITGVTSEVFTAATATAALIAGSGVHGFVYRDLNENGAWNSAEPVVPGRQVQLVDAGGNPVVTQWILEPNNFANDTQISSAIPQATLSVVGSSPSNQVFAYNATYGATTSRVFGVAEALPTQWDRNRRLRIGMNVPTHQVSIDAIGTTASALSYARLEIYDAGGNLIGRTRSGGLSLGQRETLTMSSATPIAYAIVRGHGNSLVALDTLVIGAPNVVQTNAQGAYSFNNLPAGNYRVQAVVPTDWKATSPVSSTQTVSLTSGQSLRTVHFAQTWTARAWQNLTNVFDVNGDGVVAPQDALLVINELNSSGARPLLSLPTGDGSPVFIDIDGDGYATPSDAIAVINFLNTFGSGEAAATPSPAGASSGSEPPPQFITAQSESIDGLFPDACLHDEDHLHDMDDHHHAEEHAEEAIAASHDAVIGAWGQAPVEGAATLPQGESVSSWLLWYPAGEAPEMTRPTSPSADEASSLLGRARWRRAASLPPLPADAWEDPDEALL